MVICSLKSPSSAQSPLRKPPGLKALAEFRAQCSVGFGLALKCDLLHPYSSSYVCSLCFQLPFCFSLEGGRALGWGCLHLSRWKGSWRDGEAGTVLSITAHVARGWVQSASTLAMVWYYSWKVFLTAAKNMWDLEIGKYSSWAGRKV